MGYRLQVLDLFSGIGGFSLGLENTGGFETVAFCEIDPYAQKVLKKHWPDVPIFEDVKELKGNEVGPIDLICGGYPCQPFSVAGERRGTEDDRHLWPEVYRIVVAERPDWCLFENVVGHITMGLDEVLSDLEAAGYTVWTFVIPAVAVDAPHRRDRVWIVGHRQREGLERHAGHGNDRDQPGRQRENAPRPTGAPGLRIPVADANGLLPPEPRRTRPGGAKSGNGSVPATRRGDADYWLPESAVGRVANGIPRRVDRLRCLGNAVVPQVVEMIGRAILEAEGESPNG
ncbi:MAG: DNA (cytosine-5-)-methyltransferase [Rhodospirillaceae bacterium]|nr:DNA (cytosine-5-)-methyltransferase [Rhodospirillaceae bacterium]